MEQWERNYYITSVAGAANGSSLVVMSKGGCSHCCSTGVFLLVPFSCGYMSWLAFTQWFNLGMETVIQLLMLLYYQLIENS